MFKKLVLTINLSLIAGIIYAQATWTQKADFGGNIRYGAAAFSIGNKGYVGTGASTSTFWNDLWEYNPANNAWTQKATFPGAGRMWGTGFSIENKGYIGLGVWFGGYYRDFYEYDPTGNSWTKKADFGGTARDQAVGFAIGSKGYIGTGRANNVAQNDFWEYDPSNDTWTQKAAFAGSARIDAVGFSIGAKGYIGTGVGAAWYKDFWEYDPTSNTWTQKTDFGGDARQFAVSFSIGNKGFIGLGSDQSTYPNTFFYEDFWEYDQVKDTWTFKTYFPGNVREAAIGFAIGNKGYVGTGIYDPQIGSGTNTYLKDIWEYDDGLPTTVPEIKIQNAASVFPNPSNGRFTVSYNTSFTESVFQMFDLAGRLVFSKNLFGLKGLQTMNTEQLSNGKYYWEVRSGSEVNATGNIIINH